LSLNLSRFLQTELTDLLVTDGDANQPLNTLLGWPIGLGGDTINRNVLQAWANIGFG